jgi:hypothetical protein
VPTQAKSLPLREPIERRCALVLLVFGVLLPSSGPLAATGSDAADPCAGFTWDVKHERTLFGAKAQSLAAGRAAASAPPLRSDQLYELELSAWPQVAFAAPPGRHPASDTAYGGLATLTVTEAGVYRISLDRPFWVDVLAEGAPIRSRDFQGRRGCSAPHKVVEFVLPAATRLTLQFSGDASSRLRIAISRAPSSAP